MAIQIKATYVIDGLVWYTLHLVVVYGGRRD